MGRLGGPATLTNDEFAPIAEIILRANSAAELRCVELRDRLDAPLIATGCTDDGTEFGRAFHELVGYELNHAAAGRLLRMITKAEHPAAMILAAKSVVSTLSSMAHRRLSSDCDNHQRQSIAEAKEFFVALCSYKSALAKLNAAIRRWERHIGSRTTEPSSATPQPVADAAKQKVVRDLAETLIVFHDKSKRARRRPLKNRLDTMVIELGDIFAEFTGHPWSREDLPYSVGTRRVQFCHFVLKPFLYPSEASEWAIARRLERQKKAAIAEANLSQTALD